MKERRRVDEDAVDQFVEGKLSKSIIQQARLQVGVQLQIYLVRQYLVSESTLK